VSLILVAVLLAITIGLFVTPGVGLLGLIPLAATIIVAVWVAMAFFGKRTPAQAVHETPRPELLGPGGPDDPDRSR
jgi:hypothetical protein